MLTSVNVAFAVAFRTAVQLPGHDGPSEERLAPVAAWHVVVTVLRWRSAYATAEGLPRRRG